jgi:hypothetical protein
MRLIAIATLFFLWVQAVAQNEPLTAANQHIPLSTHQIDSLAATIDTTRGLHTAISDNIITVKGKRKPQGGSSDTYYIKPVINQLLKVVNDLTFSTYDFTSYYFYNDSLILVTMTRHNKDRVEILNGRYYFDNGILISRQEEGKRLSKPEVFLQDAARYLKDAKTMFIH